MGGENVAPRAKISLTESFGSIQTKAVVCFGSIPSGQFAFPIGLPVGQEVAQPPENFWEFFAEVPPPLEGKTIAWLLCFFLELVVFDPSVWLSH